MLARFVCYGILGWCVEIVFTALRRLISAREGSWQLKGTTYLWMFPIYGLIAPLYEPLHNMMRGEIALPVRALVYGVCFLILEYITGWILRRLTGSCPWDYRGRTRYHLHGLVRFDYLPFWMMFGVALEPVHDWLVRLT